MKRIVSLLALACFTVSSSGCMTIKLADSKPGSRVPAAICEKRTAVLVVEDKRTVTKLDRTMSESPDIALSKALADKFREFCPDTVKFIDQKTAAADAKPAPAAPGNFDFLLTGSLDRFQSEYEDEYSALRMAGAMLAGFTIPVGLLLVPIVIAGHADHVTDIDFTLSLVDASSGTIIWTKRSEFRDRERIAFVKASGGRIKDKLNRYLEETTSSIFANVSSAYKKMPSSSLALGMNRGKNSGQATHIR